MSAIVNPRCYRSAYRVHSLIVTIYPKVGCVHKSSLEQPFHAHPPGYLLFSHTTIILLCLKSLAPRVAISPPCRIDFPTIVCALCVSQCYYFFFHTITLYGCLKYEDGIAIATAPSHITKSCSLIVGLPLFSHSDLFGTPPRTIILSLLSLSIRAYRMLRQRTLPLLEGR